MTENIEYINLSETNDVDAEIIREEKRLALDIEKAARSILEDSAINTVALCGPSCSGKTTVSERIKELLCAAGKSVEVISIDNFFLDRDEEEDKKGIPDFDSAAALDVEAFAKFASDISSGKDAVCPVFDFGKRKCSGYIKYPYKENRMFLFEGIQAFYPEVYECFEHSTTRSVFVNVNSSVCAENFNFSPTEQRLIRRTVRDFSSRGTVPSFTFKIWENVRRNEEANILPNSCVADVSVDTVMPYSLYVLGHMFEEVLDKETGVRNHPLAENLLSKLSKLDPYRLNKSIIPEGSIIKEFTGV